MGDQPRILQYIEQCNKPLNAQLIADALYSEGIKKGAVQRALDVLQEAGKILVKEVGKQKVYLALQHSYASLSAADADAQQRANEALADRYRAECAEVDALNAKVKAAANALTIEQLKAGIAAAEAETAGLEKRLGPLRAAVKSGKAVDAAAKAKLEAAHAAAVGQWRSRKAKFGTMWELITADMDGKKPQRLREELGIATDEEARVVLPATKIAARQAVFPVRPTAGGGAAGGSSSAAAPRPALKPVSSNAERAAPAAAAAPKKKKAPAGDKEKAPAKKKAKAAAAE